MAVYDLEEQEQISELKAWWAQYGNFVVTLAVVAALTAMGTATPQLKVHVQAALHVGVRPEEIVEVVMQMSVSATCRCTGWSSS